MNIKIYIFFFFSEKLKNQEEVILIRKEIGELIKMKRDNFNQNLKSCIEIDYFVKIMPNNPFRRKKICTFLL